MKSPEPSKDFPAPVSTRRRAIRLDAPVGLTVSLGDKRIDAEIADIGIGGLGLLCNLPLSRGKVYTMTLRYGRTEAVCQARAAHSRKADQGRWLVGMAFVGEEEIPLIERLVDALTGNLIRFS